MAGNATMVRRLGIDPNFGVAPFILAPRITRTRASELGIKVNARARAAYSRLGGLCGDIVAGALACGMDRDQRIRLFIDVGTNCEMILGNGDRLLATAPAVRCSCRTIAAACGRPAERSKSFGSPTRASRWK